MDVELDVSFEEAPSPNSEDIFENLKPKAQPMKAFDFSDPVKVRMYLKQLEDQKISLDLISTFSKSKPKQDTSQKQNEMLSKTEYGLVEM